MIRAGGGRGDVARAGLSDLRAGEGFFEAVDGGVGGVRPVAVVHLCGEGVDGGRRLQCEFVLVVNDGALVLVFVMLGGCAGGGEVCLTLSEFVLELGTPGRGQGEGGGRRGFCTRGELGIALLDTLFKVRALPAELGAL